MNQSDLIEVALKLGIRERAELAEHLLASLDALHSDELRDLWLQVAHRRDEALDRRELASRPAHEVIADLKSHLG